MAMNVAAITKGIERDEWLRLRKRGIGGSDASAVAGLNGINHPLVYFWRKPIRLYQTNQAKQLTGVTS
ncbi:YqaJ viral recombinase family protein [Paenibacillus peoriae]|uniref:YqaJ viral recombinase family protein n=1 Tax=Paenibacillus peoriae TaxID=59893 RepID=UPI003F9BA525